MMTAKTIWCRVLDLGVSVEGQHKEKMGRCNGMMTLCLEMGNDFSSESSEREKVENQVKFVSAAVYLAYSGYTILYTGRTATWYGSVT